jgi:hypothetical protein
MGRSEASNPLPHGASSMAIGNFVIVFLPDKALVSRKTIGDHFTLQYGEKSDIIDLHRTWIDPQGCKRHTPIFGMRRENIPAFVEELSSLLLLSLPFRRLRLGWLRHRGITIMCGALPVDEEHISKVTRRAKRRLVLDQEKFLDEIYAPETYDDVRGLPGPFTLLRNGRTVGAAFDIPYPHGAAKLSWIKQRGLFRSLDQKIKMIKEVALRYSLSESELREHGERFRT